MTIARINKEGKWGRMITQHDALTSLKDSGNNLLFMNH